MTWERSLAWSAGLVCVAGLVLALRFAGVYLEQPRHDPGKSDLLVILGGGLGERAEIGAALFLNGYAPNVLLTGIEVGDTGMEPDDPFFRVPYLKHRGVPAEAMIFDTSADSTWKEALLLRSLCLQRRWRTVLVVSDPPHLRRLAWSLDQAMANTGIEWRLVPARADWWNPAAWWENPRALQFVGKEICKLAYYWVRYGLGIG